MKSNLRICAVLILALLSCQSYAQTPPQEGGKIKVNVELFQVGVVVVGKNGKLITNLESENFRIINCPSAIDDKITKGKKRKPPTARDTQCIVIEKTDVFDKESLPPLRARGVFDRSGSTTSYFRKLAAPAATRLFKILVGDNQNVLSIGGENRYSLVEFSESYNEIIPWTKDISQIEAALSPLEPGGLSAVFEAIYLCSEDMRAIGNFTKFCILVTDGLDTFRQRKLVGKNNRLCNENMRNWGKPTTCRPVRYEDLISSLLDTNTTLYVIDFSRGLDKNKLQSSFRPPLNDPEDLGNIARASGGDRILVKTIDEAEKAVEVIAGMINQRHVLGSYVKTDAAATCYDTYIEIGRWRNGKFEVDDYLTEHAAYRKRWCLER